MDAEPGAMMLVDTHDTLVRHAFRDKNARRAAERDELFKSANVDVIDVSTDKPYVDALYKFFRMRERRLATISSSIEWSAISHNGTGVCRMSANSVVV